MSDTRKALARKFRETTNFLPYIDEIWFPMYKSLEDGLTVRLNWPIIALVGPNGTNKSSILQAISAAPEGRSLAPFWFSTAVDDIDASQTRKGRHRFVYAYRFDGTGVRAECRKSRVARKYRGKAVPKTLEGTRDPDYWEPTKATSGDGMADLPTDGCDGWLSKSRDRWNPIDKEVLYLDFRAELSAFDKFIHHDSYSRYARDATAKRYRAVVKSIPIARALADEPLRKSDLGKLIKGVRHLDEPVVKNIAKILGKPIERIALVEHRFFGPDGITVRLHLRNGGANYSEAHAGSGEYAVVRLVDAISSAGDRSLILLDEPEVSLHPGAQVELMKFIELEVLRKGHQVVISTHSPVLAATLPDDAIKVFGFDANQERVVLVADGCSPTEAFAHLGQITSDSSRARLIVEDDLAAEIVRAALRHHAPTKLDTLEIMPFPGGAPGIVKNVLSSYAITNVAKSGILLDGDQKTAGHDPDFDVERAIETTADRHLATLWKQQMHATGPQLHSNSDHAGDAQVYKTCLRWADAHLDFLPGWTPEQALAGEVYPGETASKGDWKPFWTDKVRQARHLTAAESVPSSLILEFQRAALGQLGPDAELLVQTHASVAKVIDW